MGDNKINTVAVSGAGGLVGSHLTAYLRARGITVLPLGRRHFTDAGAGELRSAVGQADAVVNLAGAPINHRWTESYKKELYASRIDTTRRLVDSIAASGGKVRVLCSASAVGYYSSHPAAGCNTEDSPEGEGFLAGLCRAWEDEARRAPEWCRTAVMRFGLVLSPDGGVMKVLGLPTRLRFAAALGNGAQFFPWIDIRDLVRAAYFILQSDSLDGVFNLVAPQVITNNEFTRALARSRRARFTVKVPGILFRTVLGEAASFVLSGQCVKPERLSQAGFRFRYPYIAASLER